MYMLEIVCSAFFFKYTSIVAFVKKYVKHVLNVISPAVVFLSYYFFQITGDGTEAVLLTPPGSDAALLTQPGLPTADANYLRGLATLLTPIQNLHTFQYHIQV